jgi:vacuolar iron transporter family protein
MAGVISLNAEAPPFVLEGVEEGKTQRFALGDYRGRWVILVFYPAPSAYRVVKTISQRQDLLLRTVQEKVLGLGSADLSQPVTAGAVMFLSFVIGAAVPLLPLVLAPTAGALLLSWALSVSVLLGVGVFKGRLTGRPLLRSGLEFAGVALGSALVGYLVGAVFDRLL